MGSSKKRTAKAGPATPKVQASWKRVESTPVDEQQVAEAEQKRARLQENLWAIEKQIYEIEARYLEQANPRGNAIRGFEGFLDLDRRVRRTPVKAEDRWFSQSSMTGAQHLV